MLKIALRGLVAHKARLAATTIAVMLGVSFISGTYVLTDTLKAAITGVIGHSQSDVAVLVQARSHLSASGPGALGGSGLTVSDATVQEVDRVPGVQAADGVVGGAIQVTRADGKSLSRGQSLSLALSVGTVPALRSLEIVKGRFPTGTSQAVVDAGTAARADLTIGQQLKIAGAGPARLVRLVGIVDYGTAQSLADFTIIGLTLSTAQSVLAEPGRLSEVIVSAAKGVSPAALKARVARALGASYKVQTEKEAVASISTAVNNGLSIFGDVLLVFAGVALFVAIFLIFNTFSILLAQRARELALLRCLGAYRRQVAVSVLGEAFGVGVVASILGLGLGVLLALGLKALLSGFGVSFPSASPVVAVRTVIVSLLVGTIATMVAAALPAIRGSRTPPVTALRAELSVDSGRPTPLRIVTGGLLFLGGLLVVVGSLHSRGNRLNAANRAEAAGAGLVLLFLGLAALIPVIARPAAAALGWPFARLSGIPGEIGRRNAMRHPRRTASTASALMIGLTLVTTIGVFSRSAEVSEDASLESGLHADFVLTPNSASGVSTDVGTTLAGLPQVRDVASLSTGRVKVDLPAAHGTGRISLAGTEVGAWAADVDLPVSAGSLAAVSGRSVAVTTGVATTWHLSVGDPLPVTSAQEARVVLTVVAIFKDPTGLTGDVLASQAGYAAVFPQPTASVSMILARTAPGVAVKTATGALYLQTQQFPQVKLYTKTGYINMVNSDFNMLIGIISALLGLAVVIALFGIVNTLALSIVERTREIGLMRALGMSRAQLRATIRWESVIVSLLGTLLGVLLGLGFGWVVVDALRSDGINTYAVPVKELVIFVVLAGVAGIVAAVIPARTASKVDVLAAIATE